MVPDALQAGHFFGLQRVSTFSPHFSQVKTAMIIPPGSFLPLVRGRHGGGHRRVYGLKAHSGVGHGSPCPYVKTLRQD
jgi:hypothetical protein